MEFCSREKMQWFNGRVRWSKFICNPYRNSVVNSHAKVDRNVSCNGDAYYHAMPTSTFVPPYRTSGDALGAGPRGLSKVHCSKGNVDNTLEDCITKMHLAMCDLCR